MHTLMGGVLGRLLSPKEPPEERICVQHTILAHHRVLRPARFTSRGANSGIKSSQLINLLVVEARYYIRSSSSMSSSVVDPRVILMANAGVRYRLLLAVGTLSCLPSEALFGRMLDSASGTARSSDRS
jgi:hypothetical protein